MTTGAFALFLLLAALPVSVVAQAPNNLVSPSMIIAASGADGVLDRDETGYVFSGLLYVKMHSGLTASELPARLSAASRFVNRTAGPVATFGDVGFLSEPDEKHRQSARFRAESNLARIGVITIPPDRHPRAVASELMQSGIVEYAEPVPLHSVFDAGSAAPSDPLLDNQRHIDYLNLEAAWEIQTGDSSVVIGIIDGGITRDHEDLKSNIAPNYGEIGTDGDGLDKATNGVDDDNNGYVDDAYGVNLFPFDGSEPGSTQNGEHGTQVTGFAAASTNNDIGIAGAAYNCRFFPMKAGVRGRASIVAGYDGLLYAARSGMKVANLSWGSPVYSAVEEEIVRSVIEDFDVAVVAAGGNETGRVVYYPAGYDDVIGVAGVNELESVITTYGEHIDLLSTGGTTTSGLSDYFDLPAASSYATPSVSGLVALARAAWPAADARTIAHHVRHSAISLDLKNFDKAGFIGRGKPDAEWVVSNDPAGRPELSVRGVALLDETGTVVPLLDHGTTGALRLTIESRAAEASDVVVTVEQYTDDTSSFRLDSGPIDIGTIPADRGEFDLDSIPLEIKRPGDHFIRLKVTIEAEEYDDVAYVIAPVQRTWRAAESLSLTHAVTSNLGLGFDKTARGRVGPGVLFDDLQQMFEGGIIMSIGPQFVVDNLRDADGQRSNADFFAIDPDSFPVPVDVAASDAGDRLDAVGLEVGLIVDVDSTIAGIGRVMLYVHNGSAEAIDSVRLGFFTDWDLDNSTAAGAVERLAAESIGIPPHFFPVVSQVAGAGSTGLAVAIERPQGQSGRLRTPVHFSLANADGPIVINDGFNDPEKFRVVSSGYGNDNAGPGDVSLVSGLVFADLGPGDVDSMRIVYAFSEGGPESAVERLKEYAFARYGTGSVTGLTRFEASDLIRVDRSTVVFSSSGIVEIGVYDLLGRRVAHMFPIPGDQSTIADLSGRPSGPYLCVARSAAGEHYSRLVIIDR